MVNRGASRPESSSWNTSFFYVNLRLPEYLASHLTTRSIRVRHVTAFGDGRCYQVGVRSAAWHISVFSLLGGAQRALCGLLGRRRPAGLSRPG